ncbi:MAG: hypothetical protein LBG52_09170 [Candidatus Peribacteria bacterium]|nr:hypothetical protein [Candidatus Peribacteria bacterium]
MNRGWYVVLSMMCVFVIAAISFVACHNESDPAPADDGIEYPIPENAEVIVDATGIFKIPGSDEILTTTDGDFAIYVGGRATAYYLPKDIKHYQEYLNLITAEREPNILKLTIGDKTDKGFPIIQVELPDEESEEYLEAKARWDNSESVDIGTETKSTASLSDVVPNISTMNAAFNYLASQSCHLIQMCPCINEVQFRGAILG